MLRIIKTAALVVLVLLLSSAGAGAETYVSLNGQFYFQYPDQWEQIDFNTVDLFLSSSGASEDMFNYDAVFAPSSSSPFFVGDYLILTVDKAGELSQTQIDSVLNELGNTFRGGINFMETNNFMADLKSDVPSYDRDNKVVTVYNEILQGQEAYKRNLIMWKFYNQGIATFYFYSTDSLFEQSKQTFTDIVSSFSTEDIESALPRQDLKVADLETDEEGNLKESRSRTVLYLAIAVFVLIVAGVAVAIIRK